MRWYPTNFTPVAFRRDVMAQGECVFVFVCVSLRVCVCVCV